jgi:DNA-binding XRE family transcriptional regulator
MNLLYVKAKVKVVVPRLLPGRIRRAVEGARHRSARHLTSVCGCCRQWICTMTPSHGSKDADLVALGQLVRKYRSATGMTQQDLADRTGVHWTTVSGIERGVANPSYKALLNLAAALGVTPGDLFPTK